MSVPYLIAAVLLLAPLSAQALPAFPGAEGSGAHTAGGRGGQVLYVTNLEDYAAGEDPIPGSFRAACDTPGPRLILFRVSGTIILERPLVLTEPRVTIAGQTAPGDGICLRRYAMNIRADQVILRHLRFRLGDEAGEEQDALNVYDAENVIIDHCSTSWAIDETLSVTGDSDNITVQWCIISESLNDSVHAKGKHGYGSLIRAVSGSYSFHHNIYAHHRSRCPRPGAQEDDAPGLLFDFRNNIIYDWGGAAGYNSERYLRMNYVGNYLKHGPSTYKPDYAFHIGGPATRAYIDGNVLHHRPEANRDNWLMIRHHEGNRIDDPWRVAPVTTHSATQARDLVLEKAGARLPRRDPVDARIVREIRNREGRIIDSQTEVGGWPELESTEPPEDTDDDGMPNAWEIERDLNPNNPADGPQDRDNDGYTNVEEYINSLG